MNQRALCITLLLACTFAPAQTGTGALVPDNEGFIRDWLIAGPYPNQRAEPEPLGFSGDVLAHLGGEANVIPYPGMTDEATFKADKARLIAGIGSVNEWGFKQTRKFAVEWQALHHEDEDPVIPLDDRFGEVRDWLVAFAACWVKSPADRAVQFRVGSDDGYKLYVNHELLGGTTLSRAAAKDQNIHAGRLREGLNLILLKITDRTGGHAFCLRITDPKGTPYNDMTVALSHPRQALAAKCENLDEVDVLDGEGFAKIRLGAEPRFPGTLPLSIMLGLTSDRTCRVQVLATDGGDREVYGEAFEAPLTTNRAHRVQANVSVQHPGAARVDVLIQDEDGKETLAHLTRTFEVLDAEILARKRDALRRDLAERKQRKAQLEQGAAEIEAQVAEKRAQITAQYARIEELYDKRRRALAKRYGDDAKSIDEPFEAASTPREALCLNGDGWEIVGARYLKGYAVDEDTPPTEGWEPAWVPMLGVEKYFRGYYFPARGGKGAYSPTKVDKCAPEGWTLSDSRIGDGIWYRTTIDIPKRWQDRRVLFTTEYAADRVIVYLDGKRCGSHDGWPGRIAIELEGTTPGEHELLVMTRRARSYGDRTHMIKVFGLMGDVFLTATSEVSVDDTWVLTSWRDATIEGRVGLLNRGDETRTVTVDCEAVLDGRVRINLGSDEAELRPGVPSEVRLKRPWTDPQVWGIGGKYGDPTLYHLVTTVRDETGILDQHFTRFGFRELWTEGFHYYLNGKRLFIQGDNTGGRITSRPYQVIWQHLMRREANVNAIRMHFEWQQGMYSRVADELGMLIIPQWYANLSIPGRGKSEPAKQRLSVEEFLTTDTHRENLHAYARWVKWLRNHPSVIMYSTDNEIFTQAWDTPEKLEANIRNDRLGAIYGRYVSRLDPTRLVTRDGDEGTWGKMGKWEEDPPAEIANYHYPDFNVSGLVENWESLYGKPVLFGETLYCAYGAWDGWIDAIPSQVAAKALRCRRVLSTYRDLEVSGWIGMGPGLDCFTELKEDGSGNPWGVSPAVRDEHKANGVVEEPRHYPYFPIAWPSLSGQGLKPEFHRFQSHYGHGSVNAYFEQRPVSVPNAVNAAYKESTHPMPLMPPRRPTEVLLTVTDGGKPVVSAPLLLRPEAGQAASPQGMRTDARGQAWFVLEEPGRYEASLADGEKTWTIDVEPLPFKMEAGFGYLPRVSLEVQQ